jgi:hypothetical protein
MKKYLLIGSLSVAATLASASAQSISHSYTAPTGPRDQRTQRRAATPPPLRRGEVGAFVRAARGGNPLQLINPRAPQKYYGAPQDTVTMDAPERRDRYTHSEVTGLILFGIVW